MNTTFRFDPIELPPEAKELRREVRAFLRQEIEAGNFSPDG
ncbi:MAG: acyl-CoA dehydrogenase, partial [Alphaproteobacteria bacterium]